MFNPKIIAFYLPQFHPTANNDKWWGKGFTEWTNVAKAKVLYPGHYQPKIPADLGFYDLRVPETRRMQAELAREAGISAFCYYHYWFEDGKEELQLPFQDVVRRGEPDFPFCLCWANESWSAKFWNKDGTVDKNVLVEQKYLGEDDNSKHFYSLLEAFKDERYYKINGKPVFMIYKPLLFDRVHDFIKQWNQLALENGLGEFYFIGQTTDRSSINEILALGFQKVNLVRLYDASVFSGNIFIRLTQKFVTRVLNLPFVQLYKTAMQKFYGKEDLNNDVIPTMIPNWDHSPRSHRSGYVLHGCTPDLFEKHAKIILEEIKDKPEDDQIVFLKSWNEWGEGNYMEPDMKYGKGFIEALRNAIQSYKD